ncbi:MAG: RT0821/Lpp0805 family surface protein [Pseudomonadota bacterium]
MKNYTSQKLNTRDMGHISSRGSEVNRTLKTILVVASCVLLPACSVSSGIGSAASEDELITSSISKPVAPQGIESTDAEIIKSVVASADAPSALAWQNPDTGNKGTITAIDKFVGSHGQKCKKFQTTVDTFMGIALYNGETCELKKGFWVLSWFLREDG